MLTTRHALLFVAVAALLAMPTTGRAQGVRTSKRLSGMFVPGSGGLRIPRGGLSRGAARGGRGKIVMYSYRFGAALLNVRLRRELRRSGWKIVSDTRSPRGTVRLKVVRYNGARASISIVGNGRRRGSMLIITKSGVRRPPVRTMRALGFYGLYIPAGGVSRGAAPGGRGRIVTYTYARPVTMLEVALKRVLKSTGWAIVRQQRSPRGTLRLRVRRGRYALSVSVVRNRRGSALILVR